ncbi:hypothetical protein [Opitutus sp. GAS368]|uniref:hypothetical protein n=1 Tax=Opitutus sp. GAS368 TaxID=1882749 RepID=UPI000B81CF9D|nr:hypothetical protein [Opitutus sp. GAS368]
MKTIVNYVAFLLALMMAFMTIKYPENVRGLLGQELSDSAKATDRIILGILVIGTGFAAVRQGIKDCRSRKNKKAPNQSAQPPRASGPLD